MRYMFQLLVLGDKKLSLPFLVNGGVEHKANDAELSRWEKNLNVGTDQCDLEIDVVISSSTDFDSIIPTSDGILYFLNPNNILDFELFEMIAQIILEEKRRIPIIIVFNTNNGFIKIPSNYLIEYIWEYYPFEAFIYNQYSKNTLYEILECASEAMILGTMPINIETAWMRIPFFINKINRTVINEDWAEAAYLTEIFTQIKKKFENQDYFINAEQAAWLYYKSENYLKASSIIEGVNDSDSKKFKKFYVENMIHSADSLLISADSLQIMRYYRKAAEKYEQAAIWSSIELENSELSKKTLISAISAWISACEFQNAFRLMDRMEHTAQLDIMQNLPTNFSQAADSLIQSEKYDLAKMQLYLCIDKYQRSDLFVEAKIFAEQISTVLKNLLKRCIGDGDPDSALLVLDELLNIWETFDLDIENIDKQVEKIARLFLKVYDFSIIEKLLTYIQDPEIKVKITENRSKAEDEYKKSKKDVAVAKFNEAAKVLEEYIKKEIREFRNEDNKIQDSVKIMKNEGQYWDASLILKERISWYGKIKQEKLYYECLISLIDLYLEAVLLVPFLQEINNLGNKFGNKCGDFLKENANKLMKTVEKYFKKNETTEKVNSIMEGLVRSFRKYQLYDESKEFVKLHVKFLTTRAFDILFSSQGLSEVKLILSLIKQADILYHSLSEKIPLNNDKTYEEIVKRYIEVKNISKASLLNEKIKNKTIFSELHSKILEIEEEISGDKIKDVQQVSNWKIKAEELSILKKAAGDALLTQQSILKNRNALRRIYYKNILDSLDSADFESVISKEKDLLFSLINKNKMETAGICLAIICLIFVKTNSVKRLGPVINEIDQKIGRSSKIFHEMFPVKVVDYIKEMFDFKEPEKAKEAIALFENLPLFEEEKNLLFSVLGKHISIKPGIDQVTKEVSTRIEEVQNKEKIQMKKSILFLNQQYGNLNTSLGDKKTEKEKKLKERKAMLRIYYKAILEKLVECDFKGASDQYKSVANRIVRRKDYNIAGLLILLGGISLLKAEATLDDIKRYLNEFLKELGTTKKVISGTFEIKLFSFLLKAKSIENNSLFDKGMKMLDVLPLFDEEKKLIMKEEA
ncbi:MAG: hypothetical protein ACTSWY_08885 [Promethearchaeota archaeon]